MAVTAAPALRHPTSLSVSLALPAPWGPRAGAHDSGVVDPINGGGAEQAATQPHGGWFRLVQLGILDQVACDTRLRAQHKATLVVLFCVCSMFVSINKLSCYKVGPQQLDYPVHHNW